LQSKQLLSLRSYGNNASLEVKELWTGHPKTRNWGVCALDSCLNEVTRRDFSARLLGGAAQRGCSAGLLGGAEQRGCSTGLHSEAARPGYLAWLFADNQALGKRASQLRIQHLSVFNLVVCFFLHFAEMAAILLPAHSQEQ